MDAKHYTLRSEAAARIPKHVGAANYAPVLYSGMTVFNSISHMDGMPRETVVIQGLGGFGRFAIQTANRMDYRTIAISRGSKEKFVWKLGAYEYIDATKGNVASALREFSGASLGVVTALTADSISPLIKGLDILGVPSKLFINTVVMFKHGISV